MKYVSIPSHTRETSTQMLLLWGGAWCYLSAFHAFALASQLSAVIELNLALERAIVRPVLFQLKVDGTDDECDAVANALNGMNYGTDVVNGITCVSYRAADSTHCTAFTRLKLLS